MKVLELNRFDGRQVSGSIVKKEVVAARPIQLLQLIWRVSNAISNVFRKQIAFSLYGNGEQIIGLRVLKGMRSDDLVTRNN